MEKGCSCNGNDMYKPELATVVKSEKMTELERFFELKLDSGDELGHMPGQFAEISVLGIGEAPISVSSSPTQGGSFELVVRNAGNVTKAMHGLEVGAKVGVRGPYGTTFPVDSEMKGKDLVFICGGIGLVPVRSAINYVMANRSDYGKVTILFGAKSPAEMLFSDECKKWASEENVTYMETVDKGDDGWQGNEGVITTLMPKMDIDPANTKVIVCGPPIMYKFVLLELKRLKVSEDDVYVSLERHMKCGVGKCGHCQINNLYVCQDGPVFKYSDVEEIREAI
jgi:NAD(P)H-flavin reductase